MTRDSTLTANYPTSSITPAGAGIASNIVTTSLLADISANSTELTVNSTVGWEVGMYGALRSVNGFEVIKVTAVDSDNDILTVTRGLDGTVAVAHYTGQAVRATFPAISWNQIVLEIQAVQQSLLGEAGSLRNLTVTATDAGIPLTLVLPTTSATNKFISFERPDGTEVGSLDYDSTNDQLEFKNITATIGSGADLLLEDDRSLKFGTDSDSTLHYDSVDARMEVLGSASWHFARLGSEFNVKAFGAKGDGTTDDTAAVQAALDAANVAGGVVYFPQGGYVITSTLDAGAGRIMLRGDNHRTQLYLETDTTLITATGQLFIAYLSLNGERVASPTATIAVHLNYTGGSHSFARFDNVVFTGGWWKCVHVQQAYYTKFEGCMFSGGTNSAIHLQAPLTGGADDQGDHMISNCVFSGTGLGGGSAAIRWEASSGLKIVNSKLLGYDYAIYQNWMDGSTGGDFIITGSSIEHFAVTGVRAGRAGTTGVFNRFQIIGCQMSTTDGGITASGPGIQIDGGLGQVHIVGNVITSNTGGVSQIAIQVNGPDLSGCYISDNTFAGFLTAIEVNNASGIQLGVNSFRTVTTEVELNGGSTISGGLAFDSGRIVYGGSDRRPTSSANFSWTSSTGELFTSGDNYAGVHATAAGASYNPVFLGKRARGTLAAPTAVQSGDILLQIDGRGYDGSGYTFGAQHMAVKATETHTASAKGSEIVFETVANGTITRQTTLHLKQDKSVSIGGALQLSGTTVLESDMDVAVVLTPNADGTLDFGTSSRRWDTLRSLAAVLYSRADDNHALSIQRYSASGRSQIQLQEEDGTQLWRFGLTGAGSDTYNFFDGTATPLSMARNGDMTLNPGGTVLAGKNVLPTADDTVDLGSAAARWANVYAAVLTAGDLAFTDQYCAQCHLEFAEGEEVVWRVIKVERDENHRFKRHRSVPVHTVCGVW